MRSQVFKEVAKGVAFSTLKPAMLGRRCCKVRCAAPIVVVTLGVMPVKLGIAQKAGVEDSERAKVIWYPARSFVTVSARRNRSHIVLSLHAVFKVLGRVRAPHVDHTLCFFTTVFFLQTNGSFLEHTVEERDLVPTSDSPRMTS
jgi:hypothetical protein